MAGIIERFDTWDLYGTGSMPAGIPYTVNLGSVFTLTSIANPPWNPAGNGTFVRCTGATGANQGPCIALPPWTSRREQIIGFWFRLIAAPASGSSFFLRGNNSCDNSQVGGLDAFAPTIDSSARFNFHSINSSAISTSTWYFVECFARIGDANGGSPSAKQGKFQLNVNGSAVITDTDSACNQGSPYMFDTWAFDFELFSSTGTVTWDIGPWYTMNPNGSGAGAFLGTTYFATLFPNSDSSVQFTRSTGSNNYANVNSSPAGSAYNHDTTQAHKDVLGLHSNSFSSFQDVRIMLLAKCATPSGRTASGILKSGSSVAKVGGRGPWGLGGATASNFQYIQSPSGIINPATGLAWTSAPTLGGYEVGR